MTKPAGPLWFHRCDACFYVTTERIEGRECDLWICERTRPSRTSFIWRYGDHASHYWSLPRGVLKQAAEAGSAHAIAALRHDTQP